jgi:hypothetical protein
MKAAAASRSSPLVAAMSTLFEPLDLGLFWPPCLS